MSIEKDFSEESYLRAKKSPLYRAYLDEKYSHIYSEIAHDFFGKELLSKNQPSPEWGAPGFDNLSIKDKLLKYQNRLIDDNDFNNGINPGYQKVLSSEEESIKLLNTLASLDMSSFQGKVYLEKSEDFDVYNFALRTALYSKTLTQNYTNLPTDTWHFIFSKSRSYKSSDFSRKDMLLLDNDSPTYQKFKEEIFKKYGLENSIDVLCMNLDIDLRGIPPQDLLYGVRYLMTGPESLSDIRQYIKEWSSYPSDEKGLVYDRLCNSLGKSPLETIVGFVESGNAVQEYDEFMAEIFDGIASCKPGVLSKANQETFLNDFVNFSTFLDLNSHKLSNSLTQENFIEESINSNLVNLIEDNLEFFLLDCACFDKDSFSSKLEILREVFKDVQPQHEKLSFIKGAMSDMPLDNARFKEVMTFPGLAKFVELKRPLEFEKLYGNYLDREKDQESINFEVLGINLTSIPSENLAKLINYCANHEDDLLDISRDELKYLSYSYEAERNLELIFTPKVFKKYMNVLKNELLNGVEFSTLKQIDAGFIQIKGKLWETCRR